MHLRDLSFPAKIIALILTLILVPLALYGGYTWGRGTIIFTSEVNQAFIIDVEQEKEIPLPASVTKSTGKHTITFAAPGYVSKTQKITFPTLRRTKQIKFSLEREFYNEEDQQSIQKVPLASVLPYSENGVFDVAFPLTDGTYLITLQVNQAWYASEKSYQQALVNAQQKALTWIRSQKVDPASLKITWAPYDPSPKK